ncbi:MAG TPA: O-antigen ligase family protein [Solirubrobacteraceae bacterium]|jgi:O-antigen ligase|nr:O-antigen ligase family protein [Solirubrobacteraceae bacterium]
MLWPTLLTAGAACLVTFLAKGGLNLESMTSTEIVLTLASGVAVAVAVVLTPAARSLVEGPKYGLWPVALLIAFTALSGLSVVWSVQPDLSWQDAGRLLAYSGVFGAAVALVRLAPDRWPAILGGLTLAATIVCGYALATKVFPGRLAPEVSYARLEEPYGYWNAIGLTAAMGAICCMWLGARRAGHALLSALAYPAMGVMGVTLMLAYSRGALVALAIGVALWLCIVPLRLRGAAVLIVGGLGAGAVVGWDFSRHVLTTDNIPLAQRATAGHQLGVLLLVMVLLLTLAGVAIGFLCGRRPLSRATRTRAGAVLLAVIALALVGLAGALAHSHRGFTGSISHTVDTLTNPNAKVPPNSPGRLTAVASVRARYWKQALQVFDANPVVGVGAAGYETASLRYRTVLLEVKHAHGFVVQTLADLGAVGLVLALALLLAWMAAAGRATHPFNRRWTSWRAWLEIRAGAHPGWRRSPQPYTPERIGMLSMLCLVVVFGVHSFVDWTWYVPGDAFVALLCAGWLAGRGPLEPSTERVRWPRSLREIGPMRVGVATAAVIAALLAAWSQWQPQRSVDASQEALALLTISPHGALTKAQAGVARDPLSAQALIVLSTIQQAAGEQALAKATLQRAVRLQPSNPQTWLALARHDLTSEPASALKELQAAIYLNPESIAPEAIAPPYANPESVEIYDDYVQALRATGTARVTGAARQRRRVGALTTAGAAARLPAQTQTRTRAAVITNASARLGPAAAAALRAARRQRALRLLGTRTPRAAG